MNYWQECIETALEEVGIKATPEQVKAMASFVASAHEQYGMAHGHDCIPNPLVLENEKLEAELEKERRKVVCKECGGTGRIFAYCGTFISDSPCDKCNGEGKVLR
jgi:hypothetical protein